ncbi:MAG TPA: hypothetical protein VK849_06020, partial [Longimicrobiales bacterium]|nr:hypothetical protein [Longimicrobiales bacterium]
PMTREATHGFRCARYRTPPGDPLLGPVDLPLFDFHDMRAVDDETFATYASFYAYDPGPLEARVEAGDTTDRWRKETVSFAAAYGNERVIAHLFLPADVEPPFQAVVAFPGSAAFQMESSEYLADFYLMRFIPLSGRALVYPILKGSYERNFERRPGRVARRERTVWMTQDVRRTVDYLLERPDIDGDRIGYFGLSLGAEIVVPFAVEDRFAALALVGGAFDAAWIEAVLPESAPWNFAPRVRTPLILVNGRRDFMHPYETGQVPFFDALGTPDADKRFVLDQESGHVPDWNVAVREILDFYDEYLGPVERRGPAPGR